MKNVKGPRETEFTWVQESGKDSLRRWHMKLSLSEGVGLRAVHYGICMEPNIGKLKYMELVLWEFIDLSPHKGVDKDLEGNL
jgi:hypothetical protein